MNIKAEDFPLYAQLEQAHLPGFSTLQQDMNKAAQTGHVEDAYVVALGLYSLTNFTPLRRAMPEITDECMDKTRAQCVAVFRGAAAQGHHGAKAMVEIAQAVSQTSPLPAPKGPTP